MQRTNIASLNIEELERALEETRAENARLLRVNVELDRRLKEAACENVKMRARLGRISLESRWRLQRVLGARTI